MDFEKYCSNVSNTFSFKVDKMDFECGELSLIEEAEFTEYMLTENLKYNMVKYRLVQLTKLTTHPFTPKWVQHIFSEHYSEMSMDNKNHDWKDMSLNDRLMFLEKLNSNFIKQIIEPVTKHYTSKEEALKN